jgi:hypothetical protein
MALWQMDIVGDLMLVDGTECMGGQNYDGALLTARPLSGHPHPVRRQQAPSQATADRSAPRHSSQLQPDHDLDSTSAIITVRPDPGAAHVDPHSCSRLVLAGSGRPRSTSSVPAGWPRR